MELQKEGVVAGACQLKVRVLQAIVPSLNGGNYTLIPAKTCKKYIYIFSFLKIFEIMLETYNTI